MRYYSIVAAVASLLVSLVSADNTTHVLVSVPLNLVDDKFYGDIFVGTPDERFTVTFDTGSGLTWLPSPKCHTPDCEGQKRYDPNASLTAVSLNRTIDVKFDDGQCVRADLFNDTLTFKGIGSASYEDFEIGAAFYVSGTTDPTVGSLGLGGDNGVSNLVKRALVKRGAWGSGSTPPFTIGKKSGRGPLRKRNNYPQFAFTVGIDPTSIAGNIFYLPLPPAATFGSARFWKTPLSCIEVGDQFSLSLDSSTLASFSTGEKIITAPSSEADQLHAAIGATFDDESERYVLKCCDADQLPPLAFSLVGAKVGLPSTLWTAPVDPNDRNSEEALCYTLVGRNDKQNEWVFGTALTKNLATVFDQNNNRIGIAIPKAGSNGATIDPSH